MLWKIIRDKRERKILDSLTKEYSSILSALLDTFFLYFKNEKYKGEIREKERISKEFAEKAGYGEAFEETMKKFHEVAERKEEVLSKKPLELALEDIGNVLSVLDSSRLIDSRKKKVRETFDYLREFIGSLTKVEDTKFKNHLEFMLSLGSLVSSCTQKYVGEKPPSIFPLPFFESPRGSCRTERYKVATSLDNLKLSGMVEEDKTITNLVKAAETYIKICKECPYSTWKK